jgi:hypothetical protein
MMVHRTMQKLTGSNTFVRTAAYQISAKNRRKLQMATNRLKNRLSNIFSSVSAWSSIGKGRFLGVQLLINDLEFWHKMVTKKGHQNFLGLLMYYTLDKEIQENICILRGRLLFLFLENNHFFYKNNHFINIASVCYRFLK